MLVAVKTPRIRLHMSGVGAKVVVKALRKLYGSVQVSNEDKAVDITTTAWWKKVEATSNPGQCLVDLQRQCGAHA